MFTSGMFSGSGQPMATGAGGWMGVFASAGSRTKAGISVTPQSALALIAVQRAVSILAESFAQLPCAVYKKNADDTTERIVDHPVNTLLNYTPNGWMTPFEMSEFKQICLGLRGNAFFMKIMNSKGVPTELHPLHPDRVQIMISPIDRMPYFRVLHAPVDQFEGVFTADQIHHVRWISDNSYAGLSPISLHAESIGLVSAVEEHSSSVFGNGTKLNGVLEYPQNITDPAIVKQISSDWEAKYSGSGNAGRIAVLAGGGKFSPLSMSNHDAELLLTRGYSVRDIARIYGIPVHMLGESQGTSSKMNFEQMGLEFVTYVLMPWLKRHEEAIERDLLTLKERMSGYYVRYDVSGLMRGDMESRYASYALAKQWGFMSTNEIRRDLDMSPVIGGDQYLVPLNMADGKTGTPIGVRKTKENT